MPAGEMHGARQRSMAMRIVRSTGLAACLLLAPCVAAASPGSLGDYNLPPGPLPASPPAQGPVDSEVPVIRPALQDAAPPVTATTPAAPATRERPATLPARASSRSQATVPALRPTAPEPDAAAPAATGSTEASAPALPPTSAPAPNSVAKTGRSGWLPLATGGILLLVAALALVLTRRQPAGDPVAARPEIKPASPPQPAPAPPAPAVPQVPVPAIDFQPLAISRSLVFATLSYRLDVGAAGMQAGEALVIRGDMIAAHGSLPTADQLAPDPGNLPLLHEVPASAGGQPLSLSGELRLPLGEVRPIRSGGGAFYVPLVRLHLAPLRGGRGAVRVFAIGQPGTVSAGPMAALRLDTFPGTVGALCLREVVAI